MAHIEQILANSIYSSDEFSQGQISKLTYLSNLAKLKNRVDQLGIIAHPKISELTLDVLGDYLSSYGDISSSEYNKYLSRDPERMNDIICNVYLGKMHGLSDKLIDYYADRSVANIKVARIFVEKLKDAKDDSIDVICSSRIINGNALCKVLLQDFLNGEVKWDVIFWARDFNMLSDVSYSFFRNSTPQKLSVFVDRYEKSDYNTESFIDTNSEFYAIEKQVKVAPNVQTSLTNFHMYYRFIPDDVILEDEQCWNNIISDIETFLRNLGLGLNSERYFNHIFANNKKITAANSRMFADHELLSSYLKSGWDTLSIVAFASQDFLNLTKDESEFYSKYPFINVQGGKKDEQSNFIKWLFTIKDAVAVVYEKHYVDELPLYAFAYMKEIYDHSNLPIFAIIFANNVAPDVAHVMGLDVLDNLSSLNDWKLAVQVRKVAKDSSDGGDGVCHFIQFTSKVIREEQDVLKIYRIYKQNVDSGTEDAFIKYCEEDNKPIDHDLFIIFNTEDEAKRKELLDQRAIVIDVPEDVGDLDIDDFDSYDEDEDITEFVEDTFMEDFSESDNFKVVEKADTVYIDTPKITDLENNHVITFDKIDDSTFTYVFEIKRAKDDVYYSRKIKTRQDVIEAIKTSIALIEDLPTYREYVEELKNILEKY